MPCPVVKSLFKLIGPVFPLVVITCVIAMLQAALRARFHQIGRLYHDFLIIALFPAFDALFLFSRVPGPWQSSVDAAAAGD